MSTHTDTALFFFFFFFFFNTAYLTPSPSQPSPTFQLRQSTQPLAFHSYVYIMKSPAWILIPSAIIIVYSYLVIVPGVFDFDFPSISSINLHSLQLSPEAQQAVRHQTGNSAPGYVVHLFNYCEYYYVDPERPDPSQMKVTCPNSPSSRLLLWLSNSAGDSRQNHTRPVFYSGGNVGRIQFVAKKIQTYIYSLCIFNSCYGLFPVITCLIDCSSADWLSCDFPTTGHQRCRTGFSLFVACYSSYIFTFVSANLQVALAMLHYRKSHSLRQCMTRWSCVETTLSKSALAYTFIVLILGYIELYPAITYMSQRPCPSLGVPFWPHGRRRGSRFRLIEWVF